MLLFFIGIIEMLIVALWTKWVVEAKILASGAMSMINTLIWYYVLQSIVGDIQNIYIVLLYASGCAIGTMLAGVLSNYLSNKKEKQALSNTEDSPLVVE